MAPTPPEIIWERVLILTDRVMDLQASHAHLHESHSMLEYRMKEIEERGRIQKKTLRQRLEEIMAIKEWVVGAGIVIMAISGAINGAEIKAMLLSMVGLSGSIPH